MDLVYLATLLTKSHDIPNSLLTKLTEEPYEQDIKNATLTKKFTAAMTANYLEALPWKTASCEIH